MLIPVLVEPCYKDSYWARKTLKGLNQEAGRRKYRVQTLRGEDFRDVDYNALFEDEQRMVIVMGTTYTWMPGTLQFFSERNIDAILVSFDPTETTALRGMVRMDYVSATRTLLNYLTSCGRDRIALYGFNDNASSDVLKLKTFREWAGEAEGRDGCGIIRNNGVLDDTYREFSARRGRYNAVLCANDIVATSLMRHLREDGVRVPEDLYITSFGDSVLAQRVQPGITSASLDHEEMGRQAVTLFAYLKKQEVMSNVSVRVRSRLIIRGSTADTPYDRNAQYRSHNSLVPATDFYHDEETIMLMTAENTLTACDEADEALLHSMLTGEPLEVLEDKYFLTSSALQYRKKRLMNLMGCSNMKDMQKMLAFCANAGLLQ